jgi:mitochondrial ATPase complex subunit ATP10
MQKQPHKALGGTPDVPLKGEKAEFVLGPLNKPLGVRERPTTVTKSTKQKLKDMMDTDVLMAQRRHL